MPKLVQRSNSAWSGIQLHLFLIQDISTGNITLYREQHVALEQTDKSDSETVY
jgi:hypothetical protein